MGVEKVPCRECENPAAYVRDGMLVIESKHHGKKHRNVFTLEFLAKLLKEDDSKSDTIASKS